MTEIHVLPAGDLELFHTHVAPRSPSEVLVSSIDSYMHAHKTKVFGGLQLLRDVLLQFGKLKPTR